MITAIAITSPLIPLGKESTVLPQIRHSSLWATAAAEQQIAAKSNHADDGGDLDDGEPKLHLAVHFNVGQIDSVNH
jgi:hypothetical protein